MPIYEYGCRNCGHRFEEHQKFSDPPLVACPECGKESLEKLISAAAFMLKGGGWSKDSYARDPRKPHRSENAVGDRLEKAIKEDKAKSSS